MSSTGARPKTKVGKRKVYDVPSRYLQVSDRSVLSGRENSPSRSSKEEVSQDSSQEVSGFSKLSISTQNGQGMASTPLCKGGIAFPDFNASAVTDSQNHLTVPTLKQKLVPTSPKPIKKNLMKEKKSDVTMSRSVAAPQRKKNDSAFDKKLADAHMDIWYAEYLQSVFLEQKARQALEARASDATEKLHKLLTLVQLHLQKVKSQKVFVTVLSTVIDWHNHCQKQHEILKPVFEVIPNLEKKYQSLAEAINATKHKLPVEDVILPESDEIQELLQKMDEFLSSYFKEITNCEADFVSSSDDLKKYVVFGEILTEELRRGVAQLTEAEKLCFSEAALALGSETGCNAENNKDNNTGGQ